MSDDVSRPDEIRSVLTDVLDKGPEETEASWAACAEAGLLGLAAPPTHGGEGLGLAEVGVLVREVGCPRARPARPRDARLRPAARSPRTARRSSRRSFVPRIVAGELLVAPALNEPGVALPARARDAARRRRGHRPQDRASRRTTTSPAVTTLLLVSAADADGRRGRRPRRPGERRRHAHRRPRARAERAEATLRVRRRAGPRRARRRRGRRAARARDRRAAAPGRRPARRRARPDRRLRQGARRSSAARSRSSRAWRCRSPTSTSPRGWSRWPPRRRPGGWPRASPPPTTSPSAAYWFCDRAPAALQTCHHLHGGMGVDETYPLHRYFARVKDVARLLGGVEADARRGAGRASPTRPRTSSSPPTQRAFKRRGARATSPGWSRREDRLEMMTDRHGEAYHRTIKQMGDDGWMGVGWPMEYGGKGLGGIEQQIFANEAARADVHLPVGDAADRRPDAAGVRHREAEGPVPRRDPRRRRALRDRLLRGRRRHRPRLAAHARPRRDGDHYVVNGQKMWTTGGHAADYIWLAVRTDPDAPKHKGISVLIVDTKDPGYSWTPIITSDGSHHVNATYYNDVRVPVDMLVGEENEGWRLITTQLNHERVMLGPAGRLEGLRDLVVEWAARPHRRRRHAAARGARGARHPGPGDRGLPGQRAAQLAGRRGPARPGARRSPTPRPRRCSPPTRCSRSGWRWSASSRRTATRRTRRPRTLLHYLDATSKRNLVLTFGGGVNEVQRELIAMFGLGLPKVPAMTTTYERSATTTGSWRETERIKALGETEPRLARDPVNQPMINAWLDAIERDRPAVHRRAWRRRRWPRSGRCPASRGTRGADDPLSQAMEMLDEAGLHLRARHQLRPDLRALPARRRAGRRSTTRLEDVVGPKQTGVGRGLLRHHPQHLVRRRRAGRARCCSGCSSSSPRLDRRDRRGGPDRSKIIRPVRNQDTEFFWEGTAAGRAAAPEVQRLRRAAPPAGAGVPGVPRDGPRVRRGERAAARSSRFLVHHAPADAGPGAAADDRARRARGGRADRGRRARQPGGPRHRRRRRRRRGTRSTTS